MALTQENIIAYTALDNALKDIIEKAKNASSHNVNYFYSGDKYLSDYVNSIGELRKSMSNYNTLFEDLMMELEIKEQELWEYEQSQAEKNYYDEMGDNYDTIDK